MYAVCVAVDEIYFWIRAVPVKNSKLYVQLVVQEWSPADIINIGQIHKCRNIWNRGRTVHKLDRVCVVQWRISRHVLEFRDIVNPIAVNVSWIGYVVFKDGIVFEGIRRARL